jgi:hypothetical protein
MFKNIISNIIKSRWFPPPPPPTVSPLICNICGNKLEKLVLKPDVITSNNYPTVDRVDEEEFINSYFQYES